MFKISLILLAAWGSFGNVFAASMEGGTVLTNPTLYSHLVRISKGPTGSPGEFKCLGVVLSSVLVYTSNYCELTEANRKDYHVDASFSNSDPKASDAMIANVYGGKHMNDFKQVTLELPGLELSSTGSAGSGGSGGSGNGTTTGNGIRPSPFNDETKVDFNNMTLVALAYDGKDFKAGVIMLNDSGCSDMYQMAKKQYPQMHVNFTDNLMCVVKAEKKGKYAMFNGETEVKPGMPCDDSLGSPVIGNRKTVGMVIKAFCDPALMVAFVQPVLQPDTGLKPDVPDILLYEDLTTTPIPIYTGTFIPVTGLSPRKPRTFPTDPVRQDSDATKDATKVVNHLMVWCFVVALGIISSL